MTDWHQQADGTFTTIGEIRNSCEIPFPCREYAQAEVDYLNSRPVQARVYEVRPVGQSFYCSHIGYR
jgi:hypothetical protein